MCSLFGEIIKRYQFYTGGIFYRIYVACSTGQRQSANIALCGYAGSK